MVRLDSSVRDITTNKLVLGTDRIAVGFRLDTTLEVRARIMRYATALRDLMQAGPSPCTARGKFEFSPEEGLSVKLTIGNKTQVSVGRLRECALAEDWAQALTRMEEHRRKTSGESDR